MGEWTNRLLDFFEKEQKRLHDGEVPTYEEQMKANEANNKHKVLEAYVTNEMKNNKVNERSDGSNLKQNMIMGANGTEEIVDPNIIRIKRDKAMSLPDIDNNVKNSERFKK